MLTFSSQTTFAHPFGRVSAANIIKYLSSEVLTHVIHVDYLDRSVSPTTGVISSTRLLTLQSNIPSFILKMFGGDSQGYAYEVSEIDPNLKKIEIKTDFMGLDEYGKFSESCVYQMIDKDSTLFTQSTTIDLNPGWFLKNIT